MNGITLEFLKLVFEIMTDQQLVEAKGFEPMDGCVKHILFTELYKRGLITTDEAADVFL